MPVSALYLMNLKGKVLLSRNYRGDIPLSTSDCFSRCIVEDEETSLAPVLLMDSGSCGCGVSFIHVKHNNLYLLATTRCNANAMVILTFLYQVVAVMEDYFQAVVEESVRDNFVIAYELLDEMMDFGYPQVTDVSSLKQCIMVQERHVLHQPSLPSTTAVSWRRDGLVHDRNEIFLDVTEKLNMLCSHNGHVLKSEVTGSLRMRASLSGMPELTIGLNDRLMMDAYGAAVKGKTVALDDIHFHHCVRLCRFENNRTISFVPPEGEFELMAYRLNLTVKPLLWVTCEIRSHSHTRLTYKISVRSSFDRDYTASNVEVHIPVQSDAHSPSFDATSGKARHVFDKDSVVWHISRLSGQKDQHLRASFNLTPVTGWNSTSAEIAGSASSLTLGKAPIVVTFEIPHLAVSGMQIRYLKITEKEGYRAVSRVRYNSRSGDYHIRMT